MCNGVVTSTCISLPISISCGDRLHDLYTIGLIDISARGIASSHFKPVSSHIWASLFLSMPFWFSTSPADAVWHGQWKCCYICKALQSSLVISNVMSSFRLFKHFTNILVLTIHTACTKKFCHSRKPQSMPYTKHLHQHPLFSHLATSVSQTSKPWHKCLWCNYFTFFLKPELFPHYNGILFSPTWFFRLPQFPTVVLHCHQESVHIFPFPLLRACLFHLKPYASVLHVLGITFEDEMLLIALQVCRNITANVWSRI